MTLCVGHTHHIYVLTRKHPRRRSRDSQCVLSDPIQATLKEVVTLYYFVLGLPKLVQTLRRHEEEADDDDERAALVRARFTEPLEETYVNFTNLVRMVQVREVHVPCACACHVMSWACYIPHQLVLEVRMVPTPCSCAHAWACTACACRRPCARCTFSPSSAHAMTRVADGGGPERGTASRVQAAAALLT